MSKGNMFMGQARGKVGSVVFARSKGQQITRAYNEKPNNPRTVKQMMQRSVFMAAVNFFARGRQAYFKFAFENKDIKHSDYNAFMKENSQLGVRFTKSQNEESTYPSIGPWQMTKGSLGEFPLLLNSGKTAFEATVDGLAADANMGTLSAAIISTYGFQTGDIVTICWIVANGSDRDNTPDIHPDRRGQIKWNLKQFILNPASTETIASVLGTEVTAAAGSLVVTPAQMEDAACGACISVTRDTTEGLKATNTYLALNEQAEDIYEVGNEADYIGLVMSDWKATGTAILQGSLVQ